jgi:hypothetical protein
MRMAAAIALALLSGWSLLAVYLMACGEDCVDAMIPVTAWRIERHVEPDHPLIRSWARDITRITTVPREQAALAEQTVWHGVRYWNAHDAIGRVHEIPSIDELIAQAEKHRWSTLRGNCVRQSIVLCSLLRQLGFSAHIKTTPAHAWVEFTIDGEIWPTLLPAFSTSRNADLPAVISGDLRRQAALRLGADKFGVFQPLPLLVSGQAGLPFFARPWLFLLMLPLGGFWWVVFRALDQSYRPDDGQAEIARSTRWLPRLRSVIVDGSPRS